MVISCTCVRRAIGAGLFHPRRFVHAHVRSRQPRVDRLHGIDVTDAGLDRAVGERGLGDDRVGHRSQCGIARFATQDQVTGDIGSAFGSQISVISPSPLRR